MDDRMFSCKKFKTADFFLAAICDENLLEKTIRKDPKFVVKKEFYHGEIIDEKTAVDLMKKCTSANIIGEKIVNLALHEKFIIKDNVIMIGKIPHAQFIR